MRFGVDNSMVNCSFRWGIVWLIFIWGLALVLSYLSLWAALFIVGSWGLLLIYHVWLMDIGYLVEKKSRVAGRKV